MSCWLQVMRDRQIMLTEGSFSAAILACGKAGRWERAVSLLDDMEDDDLLPNCYCYNAAMQGKEDVVRYSTVLREHISQRVV